MNTNSLYYKESGKTPTLGPVLMIAAGAIAAWLLAFVYSYAIYYIPFIYINFILAIGFGVLIGLIVSAVSKSAKVRNKSVSTVIAGLCGLIAIYFSWAIWLNIALETDTISYSSSVIFSSMSLLGEFGVWEMFGTTPTGFFLFAIWGIEALCVILGAAIFARASNATIPYCESCNKWTEEKLVTNALPFTTDVGGAKKQLETGNIQQMLSTPLTGTKAHFSSVFLYRCSGCNQKHFLTLTTTMISKDSDGDDKEEIVSVVKNLIIDQPAYEQILNWEKPEMPDSQTSPLQENH